MKLRFMFFKGVTFLAIVPTYVNSQNFDPVKELEKTYVEVVQYGGNISHAKMKLLEHKYPEAAKKARGKAVGLNTYQSPYTIRKMSSTGMSSSVDWELEQELDVLTGQRAIDESLQLDSRYQEIPAWRQNAESSLSNQLKVDVKEISPLIINSHPWEEMLKNQTVPALSPILNLVPTDHFLIHFSQLSDLTALESALKKLSQSVGSFFQVDQALSIKEKITQRLGITNVSALEPLVGDICFVSEDLDFYPSTHYALIIGFKSPFVGELSQFLVADSSHFEKLGDYLVVSSSKSLLDKIKQVQADSTKSIREAKEFHYAAAVLDQRREGIAYLSESFITKLVSAPYRINSTRRGAILTKLEALQYAVLAYRTLTNKWPQSFSQMAKEGYIEGKSASSDFAIDNQGIVSHKEWGSLYNIKPISEVEITKVSEQEKQRYDSFRDGYQSFWREFFDPIGIAIGVGDQIFYQTIILPLIDNSDYREFKKMAGGDPVVFRNLSSPLRLPAWAFMARFNLDDLILEAGKDFTPGESGRPEESREARMKRINKELQENLEQKEPIDVFNMVGEEIIIGVDGNQSFTISNIADLDVFIGLHLKDVERFKKFINTVYASFYRSFSQNGGGMGFPFFQLSKEEPLKNEYKSVEFCMIPAGFTNLYILYHQDFVYFAISQLSINRLIDSIQSPVSSSPVQRRMVDYLGASQNALLLSDFSASQKARETLATQMSSTYYLSAPLHGLSGYLSDAKLLLTSLGADSASLGKYLPGLGDNLLGIPMKIEGDKIYLGENPRHEFSEVKFESFSRYFISENSWENEYIGKETRVGPEVLLPKDLSSQVLSKLEVLKGFGVGLKFIPEGLETRIVVNNPLRDTSDPRFENLKIWKERPVPESPKLVQENDKLLSHDIAGEKTDYTIYLVIGGALVVFLLGILLGRRARR